LTRSSTASTPPACFTSSSDRRGGATNILDDAARPTPPRPPKKKPPAALPGNVRAVENRAAERAANLRRLPPALSPEDKRALLQVAHQVGGAHGMVVAQAARQGGIGAVADWAWERLAASAGGFVTGMRRAAEATPASRGVAGTLIAGFGPGLGPLGALAGTQSPPTDQELQLAGRNLPSSAYAIRRVGPTQPEGARTVMDSIDREFAGRVGVEMAKARGQAAPPKGPPGPRLTTSDLQWLSQLTINTDPGRFAVGQAATDLLRHRKTTTIQGLFDNAWRRVWRQQPRTSTF
jgi:hypothetical protein